jgi:hypothetical protein
MSLKTKYSIKEGIERLAGKKAPEHYLAEVVAVNKSAYTLTVDCAYLGLVAQPIAYHPATSSANKFTIWPVVGSMVVLARLEGSDQVFVASVINPDVVELNGAAFSAVKGEELQAEIQKLKQVVDSLLFVITGTPVPASGFQAALSAAVVGQTTGNYNNILNPKVKHG